MPALRCDISNGAKKCLFKRGAACKSPIETSHASPIEMSLRHPGVGTFEVTCDGGCNRDERSGTDPAAADD